MKRVAKSCFTCCYPIDGQNTKTTIASDVDGQNTTSKTTITSDVDGLVVLVCPNTASVSIDDLVEKITSWTESLPCLSSKPMIPTIRDRLSLAQVSVYPAFTKSQYVEWNKLWPMSFFASNREKESFLSEPESQFASSLLSFPSSFTTSMYRGSGCFDASLLKSRAILVNPSTSLVYHSLEASTFNSPHGHLILQLIDQVSKRQKDTTLKRTWHQVQDDDTPDNDPSSGGGGGGKRRTDQDQYYLTGLDIYLDHEPCIMCSMALVHSRIRRVFYGHPDSEYGGLGSVYSLHTTKSINHRFMVWKWKESEETEN